MTRAELRAKLDEMERLDRKQSQIDLVLYGLLILICATAIATTLLGH